MLHAYPWPSLDHLLAMTDDVAVHQHAVLDVPNRSCGYCTDDVGRALIVACQAAKRRSTAADGARLVTTYLAYLHDAQLPDGWFRNFMGYDRRWHDHAASSGDAVGRALWGLGFAERHAPRESWRLIARRLRRNALPALQRFEHLRPAAYAALGLTHALVAEPEDAAAVREALDAMLRRIADAYTAHAAPDWNWCEDVMTYDNARIPEALLRGGAALGDEEYARIGLAMLEFYTDAVIEDAADGSGKIFVPVGSAGWFPRGGPKSRHGQQPLEAAALVEAALAALDLTGVARWQQVAEIAHEWYFGRNTHGAMVACEGACRDGLDPAAVAGDDGVNPNMGAESSICYLLSAIALSNRSVTALRAVR